MSEQQERLLYDLRLVATLEPQTMAEVAAELAQMPTLVAATMQATLGLTASAKDMKLFVLGAIAMKVSCQQQQVAELERMVGL